MSTYNMDFKEGQMRDANISHIYSTNTSHPLTPNSQEYMLYKKYVSIHSEDRDLLKFPSSSDFEIELPEDMVNVSTLKLVQWAFPANYSPFSVANNNIFFAFKIVNPYNPGEYGVINDLASKIFEALFMTQEEPYKFLIEDGFYNPQQMSTELTNKMNYVVSTRIEEYFIQKGYNAELLQFILEGGYSRFVVVYNTVNAKIWFGNRADSFVLLNEIALALNELNELACISERKHLPNSSTWGLPYYIGLERCNTASISGANFDRKIAPSYATFNGVRVPRFYYGNVTSGDNGYWLTPYIDLSGSQVHWVEPLFKINLMGEAFMYMEISGQNCIDETKPYSVSKFTLTTNQTNGVVNSAFAKMSIPTTPLSQWFDRDSVPYKYYYPPAERIRRLKIRIRYHDGQLVNFGIFNFSFMLEFAMMQPMILRNSKTAVYPPPSGR